jgi:hypothetical protein
LDNKGGKRYIAPLIRSALANERRVSGGKGSTIGSDLLDGSPRRPTALPEPSEVRDTISNRMPTPISGLLGTAASAAKDIGRFLLGYVFRPRLVAYFDKSETYHIALDHPYNKRGMFLHVMVINRGRRLAKQCRGSLFEVQAEGRDGYVPAKGFNNPVDLHWAHEPLDCYAKDIAHDDKPTRLDVCYAHEGIPIFHFFCEKLPRGIQTDFPPGRYKIRIKIRSKEGAICSAHLLVAYDGDFRSLYMEQLAD